MILWKNHWKLITSFVKIVFFLIFFFLQRDIQQIGIIKQKPQIKQKWQKQKTKTKTKRNIEKENKYKREYKRKNYKEKKTKKIVENSIILALLLSMLGWKNYITNMIFVYL